MPNNIRGRGGKMSLRAVVWKAAARMALLTTGLVANDDMRAAAVACFSRAERAIDAILLDFVPSTGLILN